MLTLSIIDLNRMKYEFKEPYDNLFDCAYTRLQRSLKIKLKAIKYCNDNYDDKGLECFDHTKTGETQQKGMRALITRL